MREVQLAAEARHAKGSAESRRLRAAGKVPAVLYGHGIEPQPLAVEARALRSALNQESGLNTLLSVEVDGSRHLAMARQLQRDPVRGTVAHVDFVVVRRDEVVSAEVPVQLVGEADQVNKQDGLVEQQLFSLLVHATPDNIPPHLDVDVSVLSVGDVVRVSDLKLPSGVTTDVDPEEPVVLATASTVAAEVAAEEAAAEAAAVEAAAEAAPEGAEPGAAEGGGEGGAETRGGQAGGTEG
jgi:large subunit ribosomal protein L25